MAELELQEILQERTETYKLLIDDKNTAILSLRGGRFGATLNGREVFFCCTKYGNSFKESGRDKYLIMAVSAILLYLGKEYRIEELIKCIRFRGTCPMALAS